MSMSRQEELLKQLSIKELLLNLYLTQLVLLIVGFSIHLYMSDNVYSIFFYVSFHANVIFYGVISAVLVILIEVMMTIYVPKKWLDDGGINKQIFSRLTVTHILMLSAVVAIVEELVFRAIIQVHFGLVIASLLFALLHFRYIKKPLLLTAVIAISFFFGFLFYITNNILVTIVSHFLIDAILGIFIRYKLINL
jgi:uncharacterized protein